MLLIWSLRWIFLHVPYVEPLLHMARIQAGEQGVCSLASAKGLGTCIFNTPIVYQVYESLRITEDDPNLKIRELFCGANVRAWLCRKWLERAWWIAVCVSLDLFVLKQLPWGDQSSLADGQEYACSENSWKNWANTQKELRITFPGGFCLNNIQNGDPFPTEDSNLLHLPFQDG